MNEIEPDNICELARRHFVRCTRRPRVHERNSLLPCLYGDVTSRADQHADVAPHAEQVNVSIVGFSGLGLGGTVSRCVLPAASARLLGMGEHRRKSCEENHSEQDSHGIADVEPRPCECQGNKPPR